MGKEGERDEREEGTGAQGVLCGAGRRGGGAVVAGWAGRGDTENGFARQARKRDEVIDTGG